MWNRRRAAALAVTVLIGCGGGHYPTATTPGKPPAGAPGADGKLGPGGLPAAALPYEIVDARTGRGVSTDEFWQKVAATRAVCVGEEHPNPHHHWVQLEVVRHIAATAPASFALGMEMFQRPFQGPLDDYAANKIDAATLRARTGWEERWGYDYALYGATIDAVVAAHGQLLALNASKELTKKVVRKGLDSLTADEKAQVPELDLHDAAHRAWFDALMEDMGGAHGHSAPAAPTAPAPAPAPDDKAEPTEEAPAMPSADAVYTVQVIWDESMADGAARWLTAHPAGHLVILAGNGHCHDHAIVNRIKRRGVADVISLRPVIDDGEGSVSDLLAKPMTDYLIVLKLPKGAAPHAAE